MYLGPGHPIVYGAQDARGRNTHAGVWRDGPEHEQRKLLAYSIYGQSGVRAAVDVRRVGLGGTAS
jgi:hypothetical protein